MRTVHVGDYLTNPFVAGRYNGTLIVVSNSNSRVKRSQHMLKTPIGFEVNRNPLLQCALWPSCTFGMQKPEIFNSI